MFYPRQRKAPGASPQGNNAFDEESKGLRVAENREVHAGAGSPQLSSASVTKAGIQQAALHGQ